MKTLKISILFVFILSSIIIKAQKTESVDSLIKNLSLNFAVPDLPAFNALDVEPSNLLRPSTPKDFSIVTDEFYNGTNIIIPKTIAVELAPITLMRYNKLTLNDYQKNPVLYNSRISIGTLRDSTNVSRISIGLRTTLINKGDIKNDKNLKKVMDYLRDKNKSRNEYIDKELKRLGKTDIEFANDEELQKEINASFEKIYLAKNDSLTTLIQDYKKNKLWNAEKLDVAIAFVGSSPDSIAKNIEYNSFSIWITYARPIGENGQFLIGGNVNFNKLDSVNYTNFSLPARIYVGTNEIKGFVEGQYLYKQHEKSNNAILRLGCEYNLYKGLWADFSAGMYKDFTSNSSKFISNFRLVYAIPGNFK